MRSDNTTRSNSTPALAAACFALVAVAPLAITWWVRNLVKNDAYLFVSLMGERGLFETLQTAFLNLTLVGALFLAWKEVRRERVMAALHVAFALFVFFVLMEEVDWGQRALGFSTPDAMREVNRQGEMNLHNLEFLADAQGIAMLLLGIYGTVSPLAWMIPALRRLGWMTRLAAPPLAFTWYLPALCFTLVPVIRHFTGWPPHDTFLAQKIQSMLQEPVEMMLYAGFLITVAAWFRVTCRSASANPS